MKTVDEILNSEEEMRSKLTKAKDKKEYRSILKNLEQLKVYRLYLATQPRLAYLEKSLLDLQNKRKADNKAFQSWMRDVSGADSFGASEGGDKKKLQQRYNALCGTLAVIQRIKSIKFLLQ